MNFDLIIRGVGPVLEKLREERRLTLAVVAEKAGMSVDELIEYEGNRKGTTFSVLSGIAEALDLSPTKLVEECIKYARENGIPTDTYDRIVEAGKNADGIDVTRGGGGAPDPLKPQHHADCKDVLKNATDIQPEVI